jgi:3-phenylpropionate/cinnamic acid dioxygenase small subunit
MTISALDRLALSDLVHRYAAYVDDRQFELVVTLFAEDAELKVPEPPAALEPIQSHRGSAAIARAVAAVKQVARTQHEIVGEVYDRGQRSGSARGRITCVAHHWNRRAEELVDVVWHLRYDDEYELTEAGWRIGRRALTVNAIETRPMRRLRA